MVAGRGSRQALEASTIGGSVSFKDVATLAGRSVPI